MITVITTNVSRKKDALSLGKKLLDNNLIVCSNITKVTSQYNWKGKYHEEVEYQASFKTSIEKSRLAIKFLKKNHPYQIPLIISKDMQVSNTYKAWMDDILD